jgi:hypothetical protein
MLGSLAALGIARLLAAVSYPGTGLVTFIISGIDSAPFHYFENFALAK